MAQQAVSPHVRGARVRPNLGPLEEMNAAPSGTCRRREGRRGAVYWDLIGNFAWTSLLAGNRVETQSAAKSAIGGTAIDQQRSRTMPCRRETRAGTRDR